MASRSRCDGRLRPTARSRPETRLPTDPAAPFLPQRAGDHGVGNGTPAGDLTLAAFHGLQDVQSVLQILHRAGSRQPFEEVQNGFAGFLVDHPLLPSVVSLCAGRRTGWRTNTFTESTRSMSREELGSKLRAGSASRRLPGLAVLAGAGAAFRCPGPRTFPQVPLGSLPGMQHYPITGTDTPICGSAGCAPGFRCRTVVTSLRNQALASSSRR